MQNAAGSTGALRNATRTLPPCGTCRPEPCGTTAPRTRCSRPCRACTAKPSASSSTISSPCLTTASFWSTTSGSCLVTWHRSLRQPDQAALLLPTPAFRENALTNRYADPARTRANWGSEDPTDTFTKRLARDALWDEEVRRQAPLHGLDTTVRIHGTASASELADRIATRFGLGPGQRAFQLVAFHGAGFNRRQPCPDCPSAGASCESN